MEPIVAPFAQLLPRIPAVVVYLAGIAFAFVWWRRHPTRSLLVVLGMGLLLVTSVASPFVLQALLQQGDWKAASRQVAALGLADGLVHAIAVALLLAAVFTRPPAPAGERA